MNCHGNVKNGRIKKKQGAKKITISILQKGTLAGLAGSLTLIRRNGKK
jgi:hypothetical protein